MMRTELSEKSKSSKVTGEETPSVMQVDDRVYSKPHGQVAAFRFDDRVARCFDDMIRRSVPGYDLSLQSIATPHAATFSLARPSWISAHLSGPQLWR